MQALASLAAAEHSTDGAAGQSTAPAQVLEGRVLRAAAKPPAYIRSAPAQPPPFERSTEPPGLPDPTPGQGQVVRGSSFVQGLSRR
jgi:hypothetical protein